MYLQLSDSLCMRIVNQNAKVWEICLYISMDGFIIYALL